MAKKKKKGLASFLKESYTNNSEVKSQIVERQKQPKTIYSNESNSNSSGGLGAGLQSKGKQVARETATQKAERERSAKMRKGISSIVRSQYKREISKPTYVKKGAFTNMRNALAPVRNKTFTTGGQGVGNYGFKTHVRQILAPVKQDIRSNPYDAVRKVGMKGSINERKIYVPKSQRDENGQVSTNQRRLENAARGGNRKAQVEAALARTKAKTVGGRTYDQFVNAELNKKGLMGQDYILRNQDPSEEALNYRKQYGFDEEARQMVNDMADHKFKFGLGESYRARNVEDTLKRQYGVDLTDEEQKRIDEARDSGAYMAGNVLGQASQFAMTAPLSPIVEEGLMTRVGLKGGRAAIRTTKDALKYAGARIGADQIVSAPVNMLDALKEDNIKDIVKRFGFNTGLDIAFGSIIEIPALRKNFKFVKALQANDAANAMQAGAEKTAAKLSAQKQLSEAIEAMDETTKRGIVLRLNETAENARMQRAQDFQMGGMDINGGVSRDAVTASAEHNVPDYQKAEWHRAYDEARINGATSEDAIDFADASIDDAIANGSADVNIRNGESRISVDPNRYTEEKPLLLSESTTNTPVRETAEDVAQKATAKDSERSLESLLNELEEIEEDAYRRGVDEPPRADEIDAELRRRGINLWETDEAELQRLIDEDNLARQTPETPTETPTEKVDTPIVRVEEPTEPKEKVEEPKAEPKAKPQVEEPKRITTRSELKAERLKPNHKEIEQKYDDLIKKVEDDFYDVDYLEKYVKDNNLYVDNNAMKPRKDRLKSSVIVNLKSKKDRDVLIPLKDRTTESLEREEWFLANDNYAAYSDSDQFRLGKVRDELRKREPKAEPKPKEEPKPKKEPKANSETKKKEPNWENVKKRYEKQDNETLAKKKEELLKNKKMPKAERDKRIELIDEAMASKKQRDLDLEAKKKRQAEGWGEEGEPTQKYGAPKEVDDEPITQAADSMYREGNPALSKEDIDAGRENVLDNGGGRKRTRGFDNNLENAKARYDSDPVTFEKSLMDDVKENVSKGNLPKSRKTFQDFFDDVAYQVKKNNEAMKSLDKESDEYRKLLQNNVDLTEGALQGGSQAGAGLNHYKIFAGSNDDIKDEIINRNLDRLEEEFQKRLDKVGVKELDFPDKYRDAIKAAKTAEETQKAWTEASVYIWNQIPASLKEKIDFVRINAMLLNPTTHIRNYLGNALFAPIRSAKNIVGTPMEALAQRIGWIPFTKEDRTKSVRLVKEYMDYGGKLLDRYGGDIRGNSRYFENLSKTRPMEGADKFKDIFNPEVLKSKTFMAGRDNGNAVLNGVRKFFDTVGDANSWLLEHEDFRFFDPAFKKQLSRTMSARGLTVEMLEKNARLRDEVVEVATQEALRATYRDESALAKAISGLKNPKKNSISRKVIGVAIDSILPFTKTPINIMRRAFDYSPIGFIKGSVNFWRGVAKKDPKLIAKSIDEFASSVPGSAVTAAGFLWAKHDNLTCQFGTDDTDQFMKDLGKQNYSFVFHIGDDKELSFTLDWAAPGCIPLFTGAQAYQIAKENGFQDIDWWEVADLLEQVLEPTTEMSVMQGISKTAETFRSEDSVSKGVVAVGINAGLNYINQIIHPTIVSKTARQIDPIRRDTSSTASSSTKRIFEKWLNKQIAGIPFASKTLKPYTNAWDEEQSNTWSKNWGGRFLENFISPSYIKEYNPDDVDKKLLEMMDKNPSAKGLLPEKNWKGEVSFNGGKVKLDKDEVSFYNKEYAKSKNELRKLFKSKEFENASRTEREKLVNNTYADQRLKATQQVLMKKGIDKYRVLTDDFREGKKKNYLDAKNAGIPAETYREIITRDFDTDESGGVSKPEIVLYLNSRDDLNDKQRAIFFSKLSTANNPYKDGTAHTTDWEAENESTKTSSAKRKNTNEQKILKEATPREDGSLASKLFNKSIAKKSEQLAKEREKLDSSSSSKGSSKRGRSGRGRSGRGGSSKSGSSSTYVKSKIKPIKTKVDYEKIYKQNQALPSSQKIKKVDFDAIFKTSSGKIKTPTYKEITASSLTKAQKKALLKLIQKKLQV